MADEARAAKRTRVTSPAVVIKAGTGTKQQTFTIHEDVIKQSSLFFRAALDKRWKEGQAREINLVDDLPETVSAYMEWLYSGHIATKDFTEGPAPECVISKECVQLARLYIFGEKMQDDAFCDKVISALADIHDHKVRFDGHEVLQYCSPNAVLIGLLYQGTSETSPARRFLVDVYVKRAEKVWIQEDEAYLRCPEFLRDFALALMQPPSRRTDGDKFFDRRSEWFKQKADDT